MCAVLVVGEGAREHNGRSEREEGARGHLRGGDEEGTTGMRRSKGERGKWEELVGGQTSYSTPPGQLSLSVSRSRE